MKLLKLVSVANIGSSIFTQTQTEKMLIEDYRYMK